MIEIVNAEGYNDGYYWDYRIWFNCDGKPYSLVEAGSGSGYIPYFFSIAKGHLELQEGPRNEDCIREVMTDDEYLEQCVKKLLDSGQEYLEETEDE